MVGQTLFHGVILIPYIQQSDRDTLDYHIDYLSVAVLNSENPEGEINYSISRLLHKIMTQKGVNYKLLNSMIGVLECAKLELYRRVATPYEDLKVLENGDVYSEIKDYKGDRID